MTASSHFAHIPFLAELGIKIVASGEGSAQIQLCLEHRHLNSWHVAHGGVVMTMLDNAMSLAGRSLDPQIRSGVTIEMKTSFMQPGGGQGDVLHAKGRVLHAASSLYFCEADLYNEECLVAKATGTFKFIRNREVEKKLSST